MPNLMRVYASFRDPRNFLVILVTYILLSATMHLLHGYDPEWGMTNLILSIEASVASAALMMMGKKNGDEQAKMLAMVLEMASAQDKTLKGVLLIAEAQRDMLLDHAALLRALKEGDERILQTLTEGNQDESSK